MKRVITAIVASVLLAGSVSAQSINLGPGGVSVDPRSQRDRDVDRDIRREERARERDRYERRAEREERRGRDCRVVTTREDTPRGVVRREARICD